MSRFWTSQFWEALYSKPPVANLAVSQGHVLGHTNINKFGRNIEIASGVTADVWDGGHTLASGGESLIWVAPTTARTHTIASDNVNDTVGGSGAITVEIYGLPSWGEKEVIETVTMNTGSPPVTVTAFVIIHRMIVMTWGTGGVNLGKITATATSDGTETAIIRPGQGQTQMAIFGIPSVQTIEIGRIEADMNRATAGASTAYLDVELLVNPRPDAVLPHFITKDTFGLSLTGTSAWGRTYYEPKKFVGPAIIKIQSSSSTNGADVSAGFDAIIVDN